MQVLDARDLARLVVLLLERGLPGAFNAVGPTPAVSFRELVGACGDVELVPVPHGDRDFPLLFADPAWNAMLRISPAAALAAGMPCTPLSQTVADAVPGTSTAASHVSGAGCPTMRSEPRSRRLRRPDAARDGTGDRLVRHSLATRGRGDGSGVPEGAGRGRSPG